MTPDQKESIKRLYLELYDYFWMYAKTVLGSDFLANEAVQQTFRLASEKADNLCLSPDPKAWLLIALKNSILSIQKTCSETKVSFSGKIDVTTGMPEYICRKKEEMEECPNI